MNSEIRKIARPRFPVIEIAVVLIFFYLVAFRLTVAAFLLIFVLLYLFFPLHRNRRFLTAALILIFFAMAIPVDVHVRGLNGAIYGSKHSGVRFVRVVWGKPNLQRSLQKYGELIAGGCIGRIHNTRWMLVCD